MHEFVGEQSAEGHLRVRPDQSALGKAAVVAFVVLEAEMSDVIAEREKEMIIAIMTRAEERAGFGDEVRHLFYCIGADRKRGFAVGSEVQFVVNLISGGSDVDGAIVFPRDHR